MYSDDKLKGILKYMAATDNQTDNNEQAVPVISKPKTRPNPENPVASTEDIAPQEKQSLKFKADSGRRTIDPPESSRPVPDSELESASATPTPNTTILPSVTDTSATEQTTPVSSKLKETETNNPSTPVDGVVAPPAGTTSKPKRYRRVLAVVVLAVLLLAVGSYTAYAYLAMPYRAPVAYAQRLASFESGEYELDIKVSNDGQDQFELSASGELDASKGNDLRLSSQVAFNIDGGFLALNFSFDARYLEEVLYMRAGNADLLGFFLPGFQANTWYHWEVSPDNVEEFTDASCTEADKQAVIDYWQNEFADNVEITNPKRHGWLGVDRDGTRMQHYSGEIEGAVLNNIEQDLVNATSRDCLNLENEASFDDSHLEYDLYVGRDRDELNLRFSKEGEEVLEVTLITGGYNRDVEISAPTDSQAFDEITGTEPGFGPALEQEDFFELN